MIFDTGRAHGTREKLILALALALTSGAARAASNLTEWDFSTAAGNEPTFTATGGDSANFNIGGSLAERGPNAGSSGTHGGAFWYDAWAGLPDPTDGAYFQFTINPLSGVTYDISDVSISLATGQGLAISYELRSDADSFGSALNPSSINLTGLTGPVSFRVEIYGGENVGGITDLKIDGDVTVAHSTTSGGSVPEAFPTWAFGLVFAGLIAARSFQTRQSKNA